ncbi:MAG TPA: nitroreductase family protein [Candidatus Sulfotelmatobacter sp.]|nr:nitroreductase family protein [Candidatus Sulfotelmatobacter sp.]
MELYEAIEKRRSIRIFKQGATEAQLRKLLAVGAKAPSSGNRQSWEFILVEDRKLVDQIAELKYQFNRKFPPGPGETQKEVEERALNQKKWFQHASVVAVCTKGGDVASAWLAVENISLAAVADGLGSCIVAFGGDEKKAVESLLKLPAGYELTCVLKVGVPETTGPKPTMRPEFSWLHTNTF